MSTTPWSQTKFLAGTLIVGVFLAFVSFALVRSWPLLFPETITDAQVDPDCNLRAGPCVTELMSGGRVSFGIEPRSIPALEPLQLSVQLDGINAQSVSVDFSGTDMNMGFNRSKLQHQAEGKYTGQGTLSVCVRSAMEWEASVLIETGDGILSVPYRFIVVKPGAD